jgi:HPt (histidine-containing phosphotransfer) domain-containing protein
MSAVASSAAAIDLDTLRLYVGADDECAVMDFLERFFTRLEADMTCMRDTIARQMWGDATRLAHRMRSSALAIGACGFALSCAAFETMAQGCEGLRAQACFGAMERSFNQVRSAVRRVLVEH